MANTYLSRTITNDSSNTKATISVWCKRTKSSSGTEHHLYAIQSGSNEVRLGFQTNDRLFFYHYTGSAVYNKTTTRVFRDFNSWYHIVVQFDSTQSTADDRIKIYINGVRETDFATSVNPSSSANSFLFQGTTGYIGCSENTAGFFEGLLSHYHLTHGYSYDASSFGSTDATTGEWKINTSPSVTYGTQGFFVLKDGNSVTDQSGNSNNWSVGGGTLTKTEDCPSNNFATFNPVVATNSTMALTNGNTKAQTGSNYANNSSNSWFSSLGMSSGKYYAEFKPKTATRNVIGIGFDLSTAQKGSGANQYNFAYTSYGFAYKSGAVGNDSVGYTSSGYDTYTADDIIGIAVDLDNNKLYVSKNGTFQNSADPANGTGGYSITADKEYFFAVSDNAGTDVCYTEANFGNGYFGTTAVSSAGTNASGNGIFEYDVPTGFTALSTKGLNL